MNVKSIPLIPPFTSELLRGPEKERANNSKRRIPRSWPRRPIRPDHSGGGSVTCAGVRLD